jgi:hypothetical protein
MDTRKPKPWVFEHFPWGKTHNIKPRKPPALTIAYATALSRVTMMSSIDDLF